MSVNTRSLSSLCDFFSSFKSARHSSEDNETFQGNTKQKKKKRKKEVRKKKSISLKGTLILCTLHIHHVGTGCTEDPIQSFVNYYITLLMPLQMHMSSIVFQLGFVLVWECLICLFSKVRVHVCLCMTVCQVSQGHVKALPTADFSQKQRRPTWAKLHKLTFKIHVNTRT